MQVRQQAVRPLAGQPVVELPGRLEHGQEHGDATLGAVVPQGSLERADRGVMRALPSLRHGGDEERVVVVATELEDPGRVPQCGCGVTPGQRDLGQREHRLGVRRRGARFETRLDLGLVQIPALKCIPRHCRLGRSGGGATPKVLAIEPRGAGVVTREIARERARGRL